MAMQIKAEGTGVMISTDYENQYSVNIPFTVSVWTHHMPASNQLVTGNLATCIGLDCAGCLLDLSVGFQGDCTTE